MIDLTLIHSSWNINLFVILYIINILKFICIGTFFICFTSTCICTNRIVSSTGTYSGAFAYSTSTPNKLNHRLWSYCIVWQDRYWNFICITQLSSLNGSGIFGFSTRSWLQTYDCMCARSICWYHSPGTRSWGFYLPPPLGSWSASTSIFQLCWPVGVFVPRSLHKNLSEPETTSAEGISSTSSWLSAVSSAGVASLKDLKAIFLPIPLICPHVPHPVKQWSPGSCSF